MNWTAAEGLCPWGKNSSMASPSGGAFKHQCPLATGAGLPSINSRCGRPPGGKNRARIGAPRGENRRKRTIRPCPWASTLSPSSRGGSAPLKG